MRSWALLGRLGAIFGDSEALLGLSWATFEASEALLRHLGGVRSKKGFRPLQLLLLLLQVILLRVLITPGGAG